MEFVGRELRERVRVSDILVIVERGCFVEIVLSGCWFIS